MIVRSAERKLEEISSLSAVGLRYQTGLKKTHGAQEEPNKICSQFFRPLGAPSARTRRHGLQSSAVASKQAIHTDVASLACPCRESNGVKKGPPS